MEPNQQIPNTANIVLQAKWIQFQQQIQKYPHTFLGKFLFESLEYDPYIIDRQNRLSPIANFFGYNKEASQRSYLLYLPPVLQDNIDLIVLLHGTNQTIFDTQLLAQTTQNQGQKVYKWIQLADRQNFAVLIPQSRGLKYRNKNYYGWQPGNQDMRYLSNIISKITSKSYHQTHKLPYFQISNKDISIVGFSNGGLFVSDLYINYTVQQTTNPHKLDFSILVFTNYMGGIQSIKFDKQLKNIPMVIMTCKRDQNYNPCLRAYKFLEYHQCNVCFIQIDHHKHQFTAFAVDIVYEWISGAKNKQIELKNNKKQCKEQENL